MGISRTEKKPGGPKPLVPLTVVTGFLGAGKTTLINRLLREPELSGTAVIVNEFGDIALDHLLYETAGDGIIEIASGCVCCSVRGELAEALERLLRAADNGRIAPLRRVIVETTGLADPGPILAVLTRHPYLRLRFRLDRIVTAVDALHGLATLDAHDEAVRQAAAADTIVLTKTDQAGDVTELRKRLAQLNPVARFIEAADAGTALLTDAPAITGAVQRWLPAEEVNADQSAHAIASSAFVSERSMTAEVLDAFLERLASDFAGRLIRVKGLVRNGADPERPFVIHGVQGVYAPPVLWKTWPDADRRSRLVVIGRDFDPGAVERLFDAFLGEVRPDAPDRQALEDNPLAIAGFRPGIR